MSRPGNAAGGIRARGGTLTSAKDWQKRRTRPGAPLLFTCAENLPEILRLFTALAALFATAYLLFIAILCNLYNYGPYFCLFLRLIAQAIHGTLSIEVLTYCLQRMNRQPSWKHDHQFERTKQFVQLELQWRLIMLFQIPLPRCMCSSGAPTICRPSAKEHILWLCRGRQFASRPGALVPCAPAVGAHCERT